MRYRDAVKLHNGDEVTVGRGKSSFTAIVKDVRNFKEDKMCEFDVVCNGTWHSHIEHTNIF